MHAWYYAYLCVLVEGKLLNRQAAQAGLNETKMQSKTWYNCVHASWVCAYTHQLTFMSVDFIFPFIGNLCELVMQ